MKRAQAVPRPLRDLADEVGRFVHYWGFKQVHGRIWTYLFVSEEPLDAADLMERLGVSKALVSISVADLLRHDVIEEAGKSAEGTQLYRTNSDLFGVILKVLRNRERKMLASTLDAVSEAKSLQNEEREKWKVSQRQLRTLTEFVQSGQTVLDALLAMRDVDFSQLKKFTQP